MSVCQSYHDGEGHLELIHSQEHGKNDKEEELDDSVDVNTIVRNPSEVLAVWTPLAGNEKQLDALYKLDTVERGHAHVEQQAVENRKWEEPESRVRQHRQPDQYGTDEQGHTLFSE